jgi:hypothetical protein
MSLDDPLGNIEDRKAQQDLGVFAYRIYEGARGDDSTRFEALLVVGAWFLAMFINQGHSPPPEEG